MERDEELVVAMVAERTQKRKTSQWSDADKLRNKLHALGVVLNDKKEDTTWSWAASIEEPASKKAKTTTDDEGENGKQGIEKNKKEMEADKTVIKSVETKKVATKEVSKKVSEIKGVPKTVSEIKEVPKKVSGGVIIEDVVVGTGNECKKGSRVKMNYTGRLIKKDGKPGKQFDSNQNTHAPFSFKLGAGAVIKGWDVGVSGMKQGGKRILIIPAPMAYGSKGVPGTIPSNATLHFEVKLLSFR